MSFLHPEFLYLMLPPVAVLFYFILTQKEPTEQLFEAQAYQRLRVSEKRLSLRQRNSIYLAIFILLIAAMAQPVIREATGRAHRVVPPLTVALDISASMQTRDLYPSRLAVAKEKLLRLIDGAQGERIGVMAFGKDVYAVSPPSTDAPLLHRIIEGFEPDAYAEAGTDYMALLAAADTLMAPGRERNLIVMTDGGDRKDFKEVIAFARAKRIRLFILGTATPQGAPLKKEGVAVLQGGKPVYTSLNPALHALATETGGRFVPASAGRADVTALLASMRGPAGDREAEVREVTRYGQLYILPLGLALFLLLIATSSMSRRESVSVPAGFLLGLLLFGSAGALKAEPFDYELLEEAKHYYESGDYPRAASTYYRYAKRNGDDPQAVYDSAHALYREGNYKAAARLWNSIHTKERLLQYAALHNLGNAYAMQGDETHLNAALKAYQRALYLQNDLQTRENMEIVRGRLARLVQANRRIKNGSATEPGQRRDADGAGIQEASRNGEHAENGGENQAGQSAPSETMTAGEPGQMSDYEAAMWTRMLQEKTKTHLYRMTTNSPAGGGKNATPW